MPSTDYARTRAAQRSRNLLVQELRETRERARLGGFFYPVAVALTFLVAGAAPGRMWQATLATLVFLALAVLRVLVRSRGAQDEAGILRGLRTMWSIVLLTTAAWGAFSVWAFATLPEPAPLVALLFCGAFGMAVAHTLCMRRQPAVLAIATVMVPILVLLWRQVAPGVALMWIVYMTYMLLVMARSHREYRGRLELEEDLRHQRDLFERQSRIDGLTGLANRLEFAYVLTQGIGRGRAGTPLSLLILDIDYFKRINDSLGHLAGDACLLALARRLEQHFDHQGDLRARLGGEEFGILMECDGATAAVRAEAFRRDLDALPLQTGSGNAPITVSIGCGAFDPARHADGDALYRDVDAALYRAKTGGRNRTESIAASAP